MLGQSFTGTIVDHIGFPASLWGVYQYFSLGIIFVEYTGMVQVVIDPRFDETEFTEVDDETVLVCLGAGKCETDTPIVTMDKGAVPVVRMLTMRERNIGVGFLAGEHGSICDLGTFLQTVTRAIAI